MDMIPKAECKNRKLYRIWSRNLAFGVFRQRTGGFLGLREKFGSIYVFEEYHWENKSFATVKPQEELPEELPAETQLEEGLGSECRSCNVPVSYVLFAEGEREITLKGGHKMTVSGEWRHLGPTECKEVRAVGIYNKALHTWLEEMEKKYGNPPVVCPT